MSFELHDLDPATFLEEVHSFEFWFQSVSGYLGGTSYGALPDTPEEPMEPADRDRLVSVLCNYLVGETAALEGASGLIAVAPSRQAKVFLATQTVDEARHVEVFLHRLRTLGVADPEQEVERRASPKILQFRARLLELVRGGAWDAALLAQNVILESLEFAVFSRHMRDADAVTRQVLSGVVKDERRHMGFGENELGRRLSANPGARARLEPLRQELDHLVLDTLDETMRQIGVDAEERAEVCRSYVESVRRLGFGGSAP